MIITKNIAWVHLPKTAGTTTDQLFVASKIPMLWRDSQDSSSKHLPFRMHPDLFNHSLNDQKRISNFRRLPSWLLSNHQHKLQRMHLELPLGYMRRGLFWRERQQQWLPADWWLDRFDIDDNWDFIRLEHLKADFLNCLSRYESVSCTSKLRIWTIPSRNRNKYHHDLSHWFSPADLRSLYSANPRWTSIERKLYGYVLMDLL